MSCSVMIEDPPFSSWGGTPKPKSFPQSTKGHQLMLPSSPSGLCLARNQSITVLVPGICVLTNSSSPRYCQKSCTIPIHKSENVGIICVTDDGYRLRVMPSAIRESLKA